MRVTQYKTLQVDENIKLIIQLLGLNEQDLENQVVELDKMQKKVKAFDAMETIEDKRGITLENLDYHRLHWLSDWDGHEVGFSDSIVVSHYMHGELNLYIDTETDTVLEMWFDDEEEN